jgi:16S rRNA (guanine966-N2)-methyltransferase
MRIIAGEYRGRRLFAPEGLATRPTTGRVREALFAILGDATGLKVIDLCAGSGALGLEAVSRGATLAVLVESSKSACRVIKKNVETLGAEKRVVVVERPLSAIGSLARQHAPFDWVLVDPPWPNAQGVADEVARVIPPLIAPGARIVVGHRANAPVELPIESGFELLERRRWGDAGMSFFERVSDR